MGNAASAEELARASSLQWQLADLERAVQMRNTARAPQWHAILPHQAFIDGAVLSTCEGVCVLVGPVVGKVDCESARILLEVDQNADVTCHVSAFHAASGDMHELPQCRCTLKLAAGIPAVFHVKYLLPGRHYKFSFSGIDKAHVPTHRGGFHTPSLETDGISAINAIAVSGNNMYDMERCEVNLWRDVKQRVERNEVHYVLHLGGQVAMARMFDQSYALLLRHASSNAPNWVEIEARAIELLRSAYRTQWTALPALRYVLAHASNVMIWSDMDIYPAFTTRPEFYIDHEKPAIQMQVVRTVTRCARRLYHEYQRQLWDDNMDELLRREQELIHIAEKALASTARIYQLKQQFPVVESELELQKKRREIEGARRVEKQLRALEAEQLAVEKQLVSYNQLLAPARGEEFAFCIGEIGFLFLDLRSARLEPGGSQAAENDLMSTFQWEFVERQLESPNVQLWVVCSELPVVEASPEDLDRIAESSNSALEMRTWWGKHPESQERLLSLLFEWKMQVAKRDFIMLAGASCSGLRIAGRTSVNDIRLRTKAEQFIVGAITASCESSSLQGPRRSTSTKSAGLVARRSTSLYDRFEFEHDELAYEKAFTTVRLAKNEVTTKNNYSSPSTQHIIDIQHVSTRNHAHELAKVLVGPVVGFVDDSSAVILLEVDRDFDVICVITNPLTRETRRLYQHFHEKTPNSFYLTHLRSEHYYEIAFLNIQSPDVYNASLSTMPRFPTQLDVIAVCNSRDVSFTSMSENCNAVTTLWEAMADKVVEVPFSRIRLMIHLGGQFSVNDGNPFVQEAAALADAAASDQNSEHHGTSRIVEKLREMYRLAWNLPGVREVLAHGAHLMLSNTNDELVVRNGTESDELVRNVLSQVHQQYQNLLLPPSKRVPTYELSISHQSDSSTLAEATRARSTKPLSYAFGAFGLFVLPVGDFGGAAVHASTWDALRSFLSSPGLLCLILVTQNSIIEDSMEDLLEKARFDAASRRKFSFYQSELRDLLTLLFEWKQASTVDDSYLQPGRNSSAVAASEREIVFLSGTNFHSFDSIIQEAIVAQPTPCMLSPRLNGANKVVPRASSPLPVILQYVVGPLSRSSISADGFESTVFPHGTLFQRYAYHHFFTTKGTTKQQDLEDEAAHRDKSDEPYSHRSIGIQEPTQYQDSLISNQFAHIVCSITPQPHQGNQEADSKGTEATTSRNDAERSVSAPISSLITTRYTVISATHMGLVADNPAASSSLEEELVTRYHREGRIVPEHFTAWTLDPLLPSWLEELLSEPLTEEETQQLKALRESLLGKEQAIQDSFDRVTELKHGLVSLSHASSRALLSCLSEAFASLYTLSGSEFRVQVTGTPSPFVISYTIQQMHQEAAKHTTGSSERALLAGSIDAALYHQLFERCFANAMMFEQRLETYWT